MTTFAAIQPLERAVKTVVVDTGPSPEENLRDALRYIGLDPARTDQGYVSAAPHGGFGFIVYEFGLKLVDERTGEPVPDLGFYRLAGRLCAGPTLCYGVGPTGETVDITMLQLRGIRDGVLFLGNRAAARKAVRAGTVPRPYVSITAGGMKSIDWQFELEDA